MEGRVNVGKVTATSGRRLLTYCRTYRIECYEVVGGDGEMNENSSAEVNDCRTRSVAESTGRLL